MNIPDRRRPDAASQPSRRSNGSGSVSLRADRLSADVRVSLASGRRRRIVRREPGESMTAFRRRAEAVLAEMRGAVAAGAVVASTVTVADYAATWIDAERDALRRGRSARKPSSVEHYATVLARYVTPHVGASRLADLTRRDVEGMLDRLADAGYAASTVRHAKIALRRVLLAARREGIVGALATDGSEMTGRAVKAPREARVPTAAEVAAVLAQLTEPRWRALIGVMATTGMRRGEVLGLSWSSVDLDGALLTVEANLVQVRRTLVLGTPKSAASVRVLPLDAETVAALRAWRRLQVEERLEAGPGWGDGRWAEHDLAFTDAIGRPLSPGVLRSALERACRAAGVAPIPPHGLRHGVASVALAHGATAHETAALLGHRDVGLVQRVYGHAFDHRVTAAAVAVAEAIRTAGNDR
jgi:integrase